MLTFPVRSMLGCGLNQPISHGTYGASLGKSQAFNYFITNLHSDITGATSHSTHPTHPTPSHLVGGSDCSVPHTPATPTAVGLPAELLVWIFRLGGGGQLRFFSQVCKRWRVVALSTSSLWTTALNLTYGTQWVCEVLRRIDTAPLDIKILAFDIRFASLLISNAIMVMQEHLHRSRSLGIVAPHHTMAQILDSVGVEFAFLPLLEWISIGAEHDYFQEIHPSLLSIHAPNLQQLYLKDFSVDWFVLTRSNLFISSRLSTLHLIDPDKHLTPSICQLLSVLVAIPTLTELRIRHAFRIHGEASDVREIPRAKLGNLTILEVADHIRLCGAVMGAIQTPSLTRLEIEATTNVCMRADIVAFVAALRTLSPQQQVDILLIACAEDSFTLQAYNFIFGHKETPLLLITLFWDDDDDGMSSAYLSLTASSILQLPILHTATHLHVATDLIRDPTALVSPESWYEILGGFRAVSTLDLYSGTIMLLIGLYHDTLLVKKNQRDFEIWLPSLQTIAAPQSDTFDALWA